MPGKRRRTRKCEGHVFVCADRIAPGIMRRFCRSCGSVGLLAVDELERQALEPAAEPRPFAVPEERLWAGPDPSVLPVTYRQRRQVADRPFQQARAGHSLA